MATKVTNDKRITLKWRYLFLHTAGTKLGQTLI